jgi:hypothetical protein
LPVAAGLLHHVYLEMSREQIAENIPPREKLHQYFNNITNPKSVAPLLIAFRRRLQVVERPAGGATRNPPSRTPTFLLHVMMRILFVSSKNERSARRGPKSRQEGQPHPQIALMKGATYSRIYIRSRLGARPHGGG